MNDIEVAEITFAYNNAPIINMLRKRGAAIKGQKYDKMRAINKEIDDYKKKEENIDALNRPVTAFVSFVREEGVERALALKDKGVDQTSPYYKEFLGERLQFDDGCEPTDIIWENRHFTSTQRMVRGSIVAGVIGLLLLLSFITIYIMKTSSTSNAKKYPACDCEELKSIYGAGLEKNALLEWYDFYKHVPKKPLAGMLQCFCADTKAKNPTWDLTTKVFSDPSARMSNGQ